MGYLLILINSILGNIACYAQKKFSIGTDGRYTSSILFSLIIAVIACISYGIICKFNIFGNTVAIIYGIIFGVICAVSNIITFVSFEKMNLLTLSVFRNSSFIPTWLFGVLFLKEGLSLTSVLAVVLIFITIILPVFGDKSDDKKNTFSSYIIGIIIMFISSGGSIIVKLFNIQTGGGSEIASVMYFYTNFFMGLYLLFLYIKNASKKSGGEGFIGEITAIKHKTIYLFILLCSACQITNAMFTVVILKIMPLSLTSIITTCVNSLTLLTISKVIFKENISKIEIISWVLSVIAAIITIF